MQVKNIKIENYKGIVDAEVAFNDRVNVFVGSNGAGKTTLLKAIDISLTHFLSYFGRTKKGRELSSNDVNYHKEFVNINVEIGSFLVTSQYQYQLSLFTQNIKMNLYFEMREVHKTTT